MVGVHVFFAMIVADADVFSYCTTHVVGYELVIASSAPRVSLAHIQRVFMK